MQLAILQRDSSNRVYDDQAAAMLLAELDAIAPHLSQPVTDLAATELGRVPYVTATIHDGGGKPILNEVDRFILSNLAGTRALFTGDKQALRPLDVTPLAFFDDDLISIQRYPGKTNEQFTHLLVNVTLAASRAAHQAAVDGRQVRLLDPVAGRGSTLNRALVYGFDAVGIEVAEPDVDQYRTFLTTYLKQHRVKHRARREQVKRGPLAGTSRFGLEIARCLDVEMVRGDAVQAPELLAGQRFDLIVGDLPYGVQHRAASKKDNRRSPVEFLDEALAGWASLLRPGGSMGLSWNLRTLGRDEVTERCVAAGLTPVEHGRSFEHVVDRSITRDLCVAVKA